MKDIRITKKLISVLMIILICILIIAVSAWARYVRVNSMKESGQVAKWSIKVNDETDQFVEIDLADTISYSNVVNSKIAPGMEGSFDLVIDGSGSEVSIEYYINLNVDKKPTNMKFYLDKEYTELLETDENNMLNIESEILLANINVPVTKSIYWKWEYRTNDMPTDEVLAKYEIDKTNLLTQYNSATTDEEKQKILYKINDIIDTKESGKEVIIPIHIKGMQKNPEGFRAKGVSIVSSTTNIYVSGEKVLLDVEFTEGVYSDDKKTTITAETAPVLKLEFEENETTANNPIVTLATLKDVNLNFAITSPQRIATFIGVEDSKLKYEYVIQDSDSGSLKIVGLVGNIYNEKGEKIQLSESKLNGDTIRVDQSTIKESNWINDEISSSVISSADYLIGTVGGRNYYKSNDVSAFAVEFCINGTEYMLISPNEEGTLGWCTFDPQYDPRNTILLEKEYEGMTWYARVIPFGWHNGTRASKNNCKSIGVVSSIDEAFQKGLTRLYNLRKGIVSNLILFDNGNQNESVTGGWYGKFYEGNNPGAGSFNIGSTLDCITTGVWCRYAIGINNSIDISEYDTLTVEFESVTNIGGYADASICLVNNGVLKLVEAGSNMVCEMDISEYVGEDYIYISSANGASCKVKAVYLTK